MARLGEPRRKLKLLVINETPLVKRGADYFAKDSWFHFLQQLSERCEELTLWAPVLTGRKIPAASWRLDNRNLRIEPHDPYASFAEYYRRWPHRRKFWMENADRLVRSHDVTLLRVPAPMISLVAKSARTARKPLVLAVGGDIANASDRMAGNRGLRRLFYRAAGNALAYQEKRAAHDASRIYAYSGEIARRYGDGDAHKVRLMRTPHLSERDCVDRADTCQQPSIRILRVCWLSPVKGIEVLLEAIALLAARSVNASLEIVGEERAPGYTAQLKGTAERLGVGDRVHFTGGLPFERMREAYLRSDIQVISSHSEGTPRCILEGAARGLPLVSFGVGGCADVLRHEKNALLVEPRDAGGLAQAIERVIADGFLRRGLIAAGYADALTGTFERLGLQFLSELEALAPTA